MHKNLKSDLDADLNVFESTEHKAQFALPLAFVCSVARLVVLVPASVSLLHVGK